MPASTVPGEHASKTQPFPTRPAPFDIQGVREEDLIDLTPELHKEAIDIVAKYDHGPVFTPPSERGTIQMPGIGGGANWNGAAVDPETGMLYVCTFRLPFVVTVRKPESGELFTISSAPSATCPARAGCRCSNRHSAASSPST